VVSLSGTVCDRGGVQAMALVLGWRSPRAGVRFALVFVPRRRSFSEAFRVVVVRGAPHCSALFLVFVSLRGRSFNG